MRPGGQVADSGVHLAEKDDLILFFKLLHVGKGYLQDNGRPLERSQLVRLLVLGAQLQADECMAQCARGLAAQVMDIQTALDVMERVPGEMDAYPEVKALREHAWTALIRYVEVSGRVCRINPAVGCSATHMCRRPVALFPTGVARVRGVEGPRRSRRGAMPGAD
jgi:hypothetical protein